MTVSTISVVLPVHNQADHIDTIVAGYETALAAVPYCHESILVPNGCTDASEEICHHLADQYTAVRVVRSEKGGWGAAVRTGIDAARGDLVCYTNSARTSARDLTLLLLYAAAYPDIVVKTNRKIRDNWRRRLGSLLYNLECRALFDLSYWDINGTPKVFPRDFAALFALTRDDDLIDLEFNAICRHHDYPMLEVPIFSTSRHGGTSTTNYRSALSMYLGAFRLWLSWRRGTV